MKKSLILNEKQTKDSMKTFLNVLRHLQEIDSEFPLQYSICFAHIAMDQGICLTDLADRANLTLSTVSRIVGALSDYRKNNKPYELVRISISPSERRRKEIYLTEKGEELIAGIMHTLNNMPQKLSA